MLKFSRADFYLITEQKIKFIKEILTIITIFAVSFLAFYAFTFMPGKTGFTEFLLQKTAEMVLLADILYIFLVFSRKRNIILLKSLIIFIISVPLLFLLFQYSVSGFFRTEKKTAEWTFPYSEEFYENPDYSLYTAESGNCIINKGILISKSSRNNPFTEITEEEVKASGKNSFYISSGKDDMFFSMKTEHPQIFAGFFNILHLFSEQLKKQGSENSILLLAKITVFMIYILALTASFNISVYPVVNFIFYSAASFPVIYFITIYQRIIIPGSFFENSLAEENWGYAVTAAAALMFIIRKLVSLPQSRKKRK